jgi:DNA-binding MarR family transcriptional regulator
MTNIASDVSYDLIKTVYLMLDDTDQRFLKQYDLTPVQFYALLWLEGPERKSLSQLSRNLLCDPSNITRLADTLERKGLVLRQRDSDDRRVTWIALTPAGAELCRNARREHARYTRQRMNTLSEAEQASLERLLTKLRDGLRQHLQSG